MRAGIVAVPRIDVCGLPERCPMIVPGLGDSQTRGATRDCRVAYLSGSEASVEEHESRIDRCW